MMIRIPAIASALLVVFMLSACPKDGMVQPLPSVSTYQWVEVSPMIQGRVDHTATRLQDGRILTVGGDYQDGALWQTSQTAELFDPASQGWVATGDMVHHRSGHTATLLADGSVMVAGGNGSDDGSMKQPLATTEIYKPYAGRWTAAGDMNAARYDHTATLLSDGRVLVVGGVGPEGLAGNEIYDLVTGRWTSVAPLKERRRGHIAVELHDNRVLVAGGIGDDGVLDSVEIFDPTKNRWIEAPKMSAARDRHAALTLGDGSVLVTGGYQLVGYAEAELATCEVYSPIRNEWRQVGPLVSARRGHTVTLLASGQVLAIGGALSVQTVGTPEVFDPQSGVWTELPPLPVKLFGASTTMSEQGRVLVAGGWSQFDRQSEVAMLFGP